MMLFYPSECMQLQLDRVVADGRDYLIIRDLAHKFASRFVEIMGKYKFTSAFDVGRQAAWHIQRQNSRGLRNLESN